MQADSSNFFQFRFYLQLAFVAFDSATHPSSHFLLLWPLFVLSANRYFSEFLRFFSFPPSCFSKPLYFLKFQLSLLSAGCIPIFLIRVFYLPNQKQYLCLFFAN